LYALRRVATARGDVGTNLVELEVVGSGPLLNDVALILGIAALGTSLERCARVTVAASTSDRKRLVDLAALALLLALLPDLGYSGRCDQ
jgi:hypothetical protein